MELARNGAFHLIILDLMMPKIDGSRPRRASGSSPYVPIMLTARSEDTDKIIGF